MPYPCSIRYFSRLAMVAALGCSLGHAADLRLKLPKRTKPTPVQQYNRDGVKAIEKRDFKKAKQLFYKAYLLDPNDPFTLNNLGYISELEGDVDRAARFYDLSAENSSDAVVDKSSSKGIEGKSVAQVAGKTGENSLEINRMNIAALSLLQKDRAPEADVLLTKSSRRRPEKPVHPEQSRLCQGKRRRTGAGALVLRESGAAEFRREDHRHRASELARQTHQPGRSG